MKLMIVLLLALLVEARAFHNSTNCTEEFQTVLQKAVEIKNHCHIRGFYDCCDAKMAGKLAHLHSSSTGVYDVMNVCSTDEDEDEEESESLQPPMRVMCDMDTDGGGWTVIMKRKRSVVTNVNFNRKWDDYENGFGNLNTEFWLGLRNIHCLTTRDDVDILIDLRENNGKGMTWIYHLFKINGSNDKYRLEIGDSEGPPGGFDSMAIHSGKQFSTTDSDNDGSSTNCASRYGGGWWFGPAGCYGYGSILTGLHTDTTQWNRLLWYVGGGISSYPSYDYYENVQMKIRPKNCARVCKKR